MELLQGAGLEPPDELSGRRATSIARGGHLHGPGFSLDAKTKAPAPWSQKDGGFGPSRAPVAAAELKGPLKVILEQTWLQGGGTPRSPPTASSPAPGSCFPYGRIFGAPGGGEGGTCHLFSFFSVIFGGHYLVFQGLQLVLQLDDVCGGVSLWAQRSHSPPQLHPQKAFPVPKSFIVLGKVGGRVLAKWGPYPWRWGGSAWCLPPERFLERRRLYFILFFIFPQKRAFFLHKTSAPAVVPGRVGDPRGWGPPGQELRGPWTRGPRPPGRNWGTPKRGAPPALPGPPRGTQPAPTEPHRCVSPWLGWWSGGGGGQGGSPKYFGGLFGGGGLGGRRSGRLCGQGCRQHPLPPRGNDPPGPASAPPVHRWVLSLGFWGTVTGWGGLCGCRGGCSPPPVTRG